MMRERVFHQTFLPICLLLLLGSLFLEGCRSSEAYRQARLEEDRQAIRASGREGWILNAQQEEELRQRAFGGDTDAVHRLLVHYSFTKQNIEIEKWATVAVVLKMEEDWMEELLMCERIRRGKKK